MKTTQLKGYLKLILVSWNKFLVVEIISIENKIISLLFLKRTTNKLKPQTLALDFLVLLTIFKLNCNQK